MKKYIFILFIFIHQISFCQQNYFSYFQTENGQPFYVKYKAKLYSSSPNGYLILPKLLNGENRIKLGFPKSQRPEANFTILINNKDLGFKIKNVNDDYLLFNIIDYTVVNVNNENISNSISKPEKEMVPVKEEKSENKTTTFKEINDNNNKQIHIKKDIDSSNTPIPEIVKTPIEKELKPISKKEDNNPEKSEETRNEIQENKITAKVERSEFSNVKNTLIVKSENGVEAIYVISNEDRKDTIRIFIPALKSQVIESELKKDEESKITATNPVVKEVKSEKKEKDTLIFLGIETPTDNKVVETKEKNIDSNKIEESIVLKKIVLVNSDCKKIASHEDFLNLRKKLAGEDDKNKMIQIAEKVFKQKCFTTEQVKNMGVLFLNDNDRFDFFVASYPYVYDTEEFKNLYKEFQNNEVSSRFKKLTKQE